METDHTNLEPANLASVASQHAEHLLRQAGISFEAVAACALDSCRLCKAMILPRAA